MIDISKNDLEKIEIIGDRVLIQPTDAKKATQSGLILPPGVSEKESVRSGYVIKVGPGYSIPNFNEDEPWKNQNDSIKFIPLQVKEGDLAVFLQNQSIEISLNKKAYFIAPQASILMVIRDDFALD